MSNSIRQLAALYRAEKRTSILQVGRYLVVGAWNTLFSFLCYAGLTALLTPLIPHAYIFASVVSSLLSITVSFFGYKWFVFKTKGNYLGEWFRCVVVYAGGIIVGTVALPVLVWSLRATTPWYAAAPYIAGAVLAALGVIVSFFGHKNFSFAPGKEAGVKTAQ